MIEITCINFGGFREFSTVLDNKTLPNGTGKTTLLNAYYFALSGRTLNGFHAHNVFAMGEPTQVIIKGLFEGIEVRRTHLVNKGTTLYISGDVCTQSDFISAMMERGIDIDFMLSCVDTNLLTSDSLSGDDLRKLLSRADVIDNERTNELKKQQKEIRAKKAQAELYAQNNVTIPNVTTPPLNVSEKAFLDSYMEANTIKAKGIQRLCETCGAERVDIEEQTKRYNDACEHINRDMTEGMRLMEQQRDNLREVANKLDAERIVNASTKARNDVTEYIKQLNDIDTELQQITETCVRAQLPTSVELVTEETQKNGSVKSVFTLTYNGIPLKNVNRAKQIEICVRILDEARKRKGMQFAPIIIDNAESVQFVSKPCNDINEEIKNVVLLTVGD